MTSCCARWRSDSARRSAPATPSPARGADEFLVLLQDVRTADEALAVVDRVRDAFATPFAGAAACHHLTTSIGVAVGDGGRRPTPCCATPARRSPAPGAVAARGRRSSTTRCAAAASAACSWRAKLRAAVRRDELAVHFLPVVDLRAGEVAGFEALAARPRPAGEDVAPREFVALAGEAGLLGALGAAVLRRATRHGACWHARLGGALSYGLSVDVAARQVCDGSILPAVRRRCPRPPWRPSGSRSS